MHPLTAPYAPPNSLISFDTVIATKYDAHMTAQQKRDIERQAGQEAGRQVRRETLEACQRLGITPKSVLLNLKRLSRFKGAKAFCFQGDIFYSDPLDYPEVQLAATRELATILDIHPDTHLDLSGSVVVIESNVPDEVGQ